MVPAGALRLAGRMQGLYVKKGNPLNIRDWRDLARPDMIFRKPGNTRKSDPNQPAKKPAKADSLGKIIFAQDYFYKRVFFCFASRKKCDILCLGSVK
jgi:hypothetical protein